MRISLSWVLGAFLLMPCVAVWAEASSQPSLPLTVMKLHASDQKINPLKAPLAKPKVHADATAGPALTDLKKGVFLKRGQRTFSVVLRSNATTGFKWFFKPERQDWIVMRDARYIAPDTHLMGAPGEQVFRFKLKTLACKMPSVHYLDFTYMRPWEHVPGQTQRVRVLCDPHQ